MKKLIALVMTLVLAVSLAAMASAANTETAHDHDCQDCAAVSVQPRDYAYRCSACYAPLVTYSGLPAKVCPVSGCQYIAYGYKCSSCGRKFYNCGVGHLSLVS